VPLAMAQLATGPEGARLRPVHLEDGVLRLDIVVRELQDPAFGLYLWPASFALARYILASRDIFVGKRVLELGAGVGLPGLVAAAIGAHVTLTDHPGDPRVLENCRQSCLLNNLRCDILPLEWGSVTSAMLCQRPDFLIGADVLYTSTAFEALLACVRFFLDVNPACLFITVYQERSGHLSIPYLAAKYELALSTDTLPSDDSEDGPAVPLHLVIFSNRTATH